MRENGPSTVHQTQLALHGEFGARDMDQLSTGDFVFDCDERNQGYAIFHADELLDVFDSRQLDVHVQRRVVFLEGLDDFLAVRTQNAMRDERLSTQIADAD